MHWARFAEISSLSVNYGDMKTKMILLMLHSEFHFFDIWNINIYCLLQMFNR